MTKHKVKKVYISKSQAHAFLGSFFMVVGFLSFGMSGWIVSRPLMPSIESVSLAPAKEACQTILGGLGFTVTAAESSNELVATDMVNSLVMDQLSRASVAIETCEGYGLKEFCAGAECGAVAMKMTLAPATRLK